MAATQSHALRFVDFPAMRMAWPGHVPQLMEGAGGHNQCRIYLFGGWAKNPNLVFGIRHEGEGDGRTS
jgi:hypothetical protein